MKKIIIFLVAAMIFSGCTAGTQEDVQIEQDNENSQAIEGSEQTEEENDLVQIETIVIKGIIAEINEDMVTVEVLEGDVNPVIIIKISDETEMTLPLDMMKIGQYIAAEISPAMTRSIPPQSNAINILSLNDVVLGEVTEINGDQIVLKPVNFNNHESIVITISEETIWDVEQSSVSVGQYIRVAIGMQMTMSIPPITSSVRVLSVETHD